ncbi:unnamed protein product [Didymodactylos carnosus]|uniref:Non-specific protein-tyrosine kinase n=1 Tax=Didymodactylos carnosus TaxID=1234261 RepID=A0A815UT36_9BILA|nr:unnamed protein product [Didymodactylos carnosus]CAF1524070.1 unnamed protein product [Didymodactylos carnosus]CAF4176512.1 unnamed protein product [Didymodactylos carnosus]CAF4383172.1 unnamed protein product [Didymodactylos carnosus]
MEDPVTAQDSYTYERKAIMEWIRQYGTSPLTSQTITAETLLENQNVRKLIQDFKARAKDLNYQYELGVDIRKKARRPLFETYGKTIYPAEWLTNIDGPEIVLLKMNGARAKKEASLYVKLSCHPHIVRTYGLVNVRSDHPTSNSIMLLQEEASEGNLSEYLLDLAELPNENILREIFIQITDAMTFLARNHVIHGDLACRNVLVFAFNPTELKRNLVKLTDFGLSRASILYATVSCASRTVFDIVPIRYAALEILLNNSPDSYSEQSDMYSMGVLMWEALSKGTMPWYLLEHDADVQRQVTSGKRLEQPASCSSKLWLIIRKSMAQQPKDRPDFDTLRTMLLQNSMQPLSTQCATKFLEEVESLLTVGCAMYSKFLRRNGASSNKLR